MAQQIIPTAQLVLKFQSIGRCNNYDVLQIIPCSPECKIMKTDSKVPDTKDTIKFKLDTQEITYTVDMFCDTLHLPVETLGNPFIAPVNIKVFNRCLTTQTSMHDQTKINILQLYHDVVNRTHVDYAALLWWDFINCVFQKKDVIQYPRFTNLIIADLMKKFPSIPQIIDEDYHSIKDDILLVSVYTTWNVQVRGMLIPDAFLTEEIRDTNDYLKYETLFVKVVVPMNQPQSVVSTAGTHKTTPRSHRIHTLTAASPQGKKRKQSAREKSSPRKSLKNIAKVQEKLDEDEIEKMVKCEEDEKSYASEFADYMFNDDDDDSDDKKDEGEEKDYDVEKTGDAAKEKDNVDHTDQTLVKIHAMGSMETRNEQMQTPIPTPNRSPRKDLSSDKTIFEELTATVSPATATTSKPKSKKGFTSNKTEILSRSIAGMCRRRG
ncbi:hypothetical protein Tco_0184963 [Tanacetum coccineum]